MFIRKILAFIYTVIISAPIIGFSFMLIEGSTIQEIPGLIAFASMYMIPIIILFGVPVSILSDKICDRFIGSKRVLSSLAVHLFFGISFTFLFIIITDSRFIFTNFSFGDLYFLVPSMLISFVGWKYGRDFENIF